MSDVNFALLIGRLTRDPELKYLTDGTALATFSIAVNGFKKDDVSYFDCTAWSKTAEAVAEYLKKGKRVAVSGHLKQNRWKNAEGGNRSKIEIVAEAVQFLDAAEKKTKVTYEGQEKNSPESDGEEVPA